MRRLRSGGIRGERPCPAVSVLPLTSIRSTYTRGLSRIWKVMPIVRSSLLRVIARIDVGKGIAEQAGGFGQRFDRILDQFGIIPIALFDRKPRLQRLRCRNRGSALFDLDVAEFVALAFFHHIGDDEILLVAGQFGNRRNYPEIGIAFGQVELAQLLLVVRQAIRIVARVRRQDRGQARLLGRHFATQLAIGKLLVAENVDLPNLRFRSFVDVENDIDAVLVELDDLGFDGCGEPALTLVKLDDPGNVGADFGARVDLARGKLDLGVDLLILEPLVAFEQDAVDDRILALLGSSRLP